MNVPNKLTLLRIFLVPIFLIFVFSKITMFNMDIGRVCALVIFIIASFTDMLDGFIARKYNLITKFGIIMDPLADKLLICSALIALVQMQKIEAWVVIIIVSREFVITGFRVIAASQDIILAAGISGKIKTVLQVLTVIVILANFKFSGADLIENLLIIFSVLLTVISAIEYIVKNRMVINKIVHEA